MDDIPTYEGNLFIQYVVIHLIMLDRLFPLKSAPHIVVTHRLMYASANYVIIGSDNGLAPIWRRTTI